MRNGGPGSVAADVNNRHPLQDRLSKWEETQMALKMEGLRRLYGAAEPIRREMEVMMCAVGFAPPNLSLLGLLEGGKEGR
jgi:proteasome maturation protein